MHFDHERVPERGSYDSIPPVTLLTCRKLYMHAVPEPMAFLRLTETGRI